MKSMPTQMTDPPKRPFAPFLPTRIRIRWRRHLVRGAAAFGVGLLVLGCAHRIAARSGPKSLPNLAIATAGGQQLWADVAWDDGWRVQTHVWTGHARLLDDGDVRRAWGSREACERGLRDRRAGGEAAAPRDQAVVILHGLWRTRDAMRDLKAAFEGAGYDVIDVCYPSTRRTIAEHAAEVAGLLDQLPGDDVEISFVTHSLGSLVVRDLLAREGDPWRERQRLGRAVFIAAPSSGAALANFGSRVPGALTIYGKPSREIAAGIADELPAPPLPFALIAACRGTEDGWNPLIPGDDDGVVGVAETALIGSSESLVVRGTHTFVMQDEGVVEAALGFVRDGSFPARE
ncbi:Alpha/beta hydrolase family protein [Planctomycetes bacterium Poly30]|uniref:Alpha/beta hydrolase family protein n=1 Tax=Saltatorellus ferox TaxID=2528018 RepID=A0A518F0K7_9BACT|nr:Alpha/beta hydrolase family protein [Planctomycetes bacterium Poly30]